MDLVLSGEEELIGEVVTEGRLGQSDHEILNMTIKGRAKSGGKQEWFRDFHRAKYGEMRTELSRDWDNELNGKGVDDMWSTIKGAIQNSVERNVPMRRRRKRIIKEKKRKWKEWKEKKTEEKKREYKKIETETKSKIRNKKKSFEKKIAKESKTNPKSFFAYVNGRRRAEIGPLKKDGKIVVEPKEQADLLNTYYASVFTRSDTPAPKVEEGTGERLTESEITEEDVYN